MLCEPRLALEHVGRDFFNRRTVALAEQADEKGAAALDLGQADGKRLAFGFLLVGHSPPKVDIGPGDTATFAQLAELREGALDQFVALGMHIAEGGGDEHADMALRKEGQCAWSCRRAVIRTHRRFYVLWRMAR